MREVIQVNIGGCGNNIGQDLWKLLGQEHGVTSNGSAEGTDEQMENIHVYYNETDKNRYVPRSIFADLDPRGIDSVIMGDLGQLFNMDNYLSGVTGTNSNWGTGHYTEGPCIIGNCSGIPVIRLKLWI